MLLSPFDFFSPEENNTNARQFAEAGSALTAAVMMGAPLLAGALYAGAVAPENAQRQSSVHPSLERSPIRRRDDFGKQSTGPNYIQKDEKDSEESDFTWES